MAATLGPLELWGGLECTVVRIGDRYRDQLVETGHRDRLDDLDRVAELGIRTLRYPLVWETVAPDRPDDRDFGWHDGRFARLRELGIRPVAGLVHHGSGPRYTALTDPAFPDLLADYAEAAARRFPWIDLWTPVNEPLTTARFSCLYGHWYPHARDYGESLRAVTRQCVATVRAMRAIRRVNPKANLVQTEDLGRVFSTPALAYQAEHENERRWLSYDLLFGRVDRHHPWWRILQDHGVSERDLDELSQSSVRPDVVGINHYLTSDRYLDQAVERYPASLAGENGRDVYADVEAVRVPLPEGSVGPGARLREAWERYRTPVAVTEVHHGCSRDEQLRWLARVWNDAADLRRDGADIRAVSIWSLFGAKDWNSLLTREAGIYEPGAFDIRGAAPRVTGIGHAAQRLAYTGTLDHPVLDTPGWWERPGRFYHPDAAPVAPLAPSPRAILLVGSRTDAFSRVADARGLAFRRAGDADDDRRSDRLGLKTGALWAAVALLVDGRSPSGPEAERLGELAAACHSAGRPFLMIASGYVFSGPDDLPATEHDPVASDTGLAALEARIAAACPEALRVRAGPVFGPWGPDRPDAPPADPDSSEEDLPVEDELVSPSYLPDLLHVALDLLIDGESGPWHLANGLATRSDLPGALIRPRPAAARDPAIGPGRRRRSLATARGQQMPPLASALERFIAARELG